jgi:transcriptional regulator with XRE-family HTH domain
MPRPTQIDRTPMSQAIRRFRVSLGDTQRDFAQRTGLALTTIARYETNAQPSKEVLTKLADIAKLEGLPFFASIFLGERKPDSSEFENQALKGAIRKLYTALLGLEEKKIGYRKARLLLTVHLLPESRYAKAEEMLAKLVPEALVEETLELAAADIVRHTVPHTKHRVVHFTCTNCGVINSFDKSILKRRLEEPRSENGLELLKCVTCRMDLTETPDGFIREFSEILPGVDEQCSEAATV